MIQSAGLLVYRVVGDRVQVLLTHPGGPIWGKKDWWSIPKGELDDGEELLAAARREFIEELGVAPPEGELVDLGSIRQNSSKTNYIWAVEGDVDISHFVSNTFTMEWPPRSGVQQEFPENDRAAWFSVRTAQRKVFKDQAAFFDRFAAFLQNKYPDLDFEAADPDEAGRPSLF